MNESDVSELAARARAGDRQAFELLVRRLVRPALAAAWEFVPTREDAEEFVQDAFARCWKEFGRYDPARPFAPWFFAVVRNVARCAQCLFLWNRALHTGRGHRQAVLSTMR